LLKTSKTLERLDLSGVRFIGSNLAEILVSLAQNSTLRELNERFRQRLTRPGPAAGARSAARHDCMVFANRHR
jgi:hypothetical protein